VGVYDVQCPPTHVASPVAIVAPGWKVETRDSVAPAAEALLRAGFVVVTVEPTGIADDEEDRIAYTARVSSVIAEVIDHATCPTTGDVVVWGVSRGGVASVGVRDTHVRAIVALFVANMCKNVRYQECDGPTEIPTLIIDGEPRPSREHAFILDVVGAMECDLHRSDHCLQSVCLLRYGRQIAVAPSVGGYAHAGDTGVALGLFVGLRDDRDDGPFDEPVGLRIDGRLGTGSSTERTVGISLVADIPGFVISVYRLYALLLRAR
jgi:hypothetical protein